MRFMFVWEDRKFLAFNKNGRLKQKYLDSFEHGRKVREIQGRFIYEHVEDFFNLLEKRYVQKILEDISYILTQRWATTVWEHDFNHGHICGKAKTPLEDLDALLSPSNVCFLYHTYEHKSWVPEAVNRNILSFPNEDPKVVHPDYEFGKYTGYGVSSEKLGLIEYARFFFKENSESPYMLKDGNKIDLWGMFP